MQSYWYKSLRIDDAGLLRSVYADHLWTADGNRAECQCLSGGLNHVDEGRRWPHDTPCPEPPDATCYCGFYCVPTPERVGRFLPTGGNQLCICLVYPYGRCVEHEDGVLRAQGMMVLAVVLLHEAGYPRLSEEDAVRLVRRVGENTGLPTTSVGSLTEACEWLREQAIPREPEESIAYG